MSGANIIVEKRFIKIGLRNEAGMVAVVSGLKADESLLAKP
tara:strand:- start:30 stop:152 length:123 start_codon:yes stop_codon:yes gene_type:complete